MMPNLRAPLRLLGRRATVLVIQQQVVDHEVIQAPKDAPRVSVVLVPLSPRRVALKPEGQRAWKWWQAISTTPLSLGWHLQADRDGKRIYKVIAQEDWRQVGIYSYEVVERAQSSAPNAAREAQP